MDSWSVEPPITSVELHCELFPPGRQVATESANPSEQSESRAAESDSENRKYAD